MALIKQFIDEKGVETNYHIIHNFNFTSDKIVVNLHSYTTQDVREREKEIIENNKRVAEYDEKINNLQNKLDGIIGDESKNDQIAELAKQINDLSLNENKPTRQPIIEAFYSKREVEIKPIEPVCRKSIYQELIKTDPTFELAESDE